MTFIKKYIYTFKRCMELTKENIRITAQLEEANRVVMFYAKMQDQAVVAPVVIINFNKAVSYCYKYSIPTE